MLEEYRSGIVTELAESDGRRPLKATIGGKVVNIWPTLFTDEPGVLGPENPIVKAVRYAAQTGAPICVYGVSKPNAKGGSSFYGYEIGEPPAAVSTLGVHPAGSVRDVPAPVVDTWSNVLTATIATVEALAAGIDIDDELFWQKVIRVMIKTQSIAEPE